MIKQKSETLRSLKIEKELWRLLRDVSRSCFFFLRFLPRRIRPAIAIGYLLARASDTVADISDLNGKIRLETLRLLNESLVNLSSGLEPKLLECAEALPRCSERVLLNKVLHILTYLERVSDRERALITDVLRKIIHGQCLDLERFEMKLGVQMLQSETELDEYTYLVAGAVGEFWSELCLDGWKNYSQISESELVRLGVEMGKGLQLINILRDYPEDLKSGRCYLPLKSLSDSDANKQLYEKWHLQATRYLRSGWSYVDSIRPIRVRFACALPLLIGIRTLQRLRFPVQNKVKVSRNEVYRLTMLSWVAALFPWVWRRLRKARFE
jgi:farnesyl-diphosphate farnesyltransferase